VTIIVPKSGQWGWRSTPTKVGSGELFSLHTYEGMELSSRGPPVGAEPSSIASFCGVEGSGGVDFEKRNDFICINYRVPLFKSIVMALLTFTCNVILFR
jgi:hypothetical protein